MVYIEPLNPFHKSPELERNRRAFFEAHGVTKRVSVVTAVRKHEKARYVLEMPPVGSSNGFFDHAELFETSDGHLIGVASPYESEANRNYFNSLGGWHECPGMYESSCPSYFKKVDESANLDTVFEGHMRKIVELNFEPVRDAFITEREICEWLDEPPTLARVFRYKKPKNMFPTVDFPDFNKGLTCVLGPLMSATQLARALERPLMEAELGRMRLKGKCFFGWRIRTARPDFANLTN
jgi:hypothetical protein